MTPSIYPDTGGRPIVHLHAGQVVATKTPTLVSTVLGSCVSVTLYCPKLKGGAICHAQFPRLPKGKAVKNPLLYADAAVEDLINRMKSLGAKVSDFQVKIFGASSVMSSAGGSRPTGVGRNNSEAALETLTKSGLKPEKSLLHTDRGMRIYFYTDSGAVLLRRNRAEALAPLLLVPDERVKPNTLPMAIDSLKLK